MLRASIKTSVGRPYVAALLAKGRPLGRPHRPTPTKVARRGTPGSVRRSKRHLVPQRLKELN